MNKKQRLQLCASNRVASSIPYLSTGTKLAYYLEVSVVMQDPITYVSGAVSWHFNEDVSLHCQRIYEWDRQILSMLDGVDDNHYITGESMRHAYNITLISSQDPDD